MAMLSEMSREVERRSDLLYEARCRNIFQYNERGGSLRHKIIMITEYHRLFSSNKQAAMAYILRLSQLAGPCGIHLILASSNPTCLRGLKESFPARVCLKVRSASDSVALLDQKGAEALPRKGSLLYMDGRDPDPQMLQSGSVTTKEVRGIITALKSNYINIRKQSIFDEIEDEDPEDQRDRSSQKGILSRFRK
jgi:DNA segregation ATPase FtsK/SpoIIIE-like protein